MKKIYLYRSPDGRVPFLDFLDVAEEKLRQKLVYGLRCLAAFPERMTEPQVKHFSIERYKALYEYRERIRILVRVIFTLDKNGDIIILHPFVKRHDRNTMQALESSIRVLDCIRASPDCLVEFEWRGGAEHEKK